MEHVWKLDLDKNDLHRFGVAKFKDQNAIIREIKKPNPLLRKKGKIRNIGKPGITNQNTCLLIVDICSISFVSTQIHISEIIETNGSAIIIAAMVVDRLLTSVATKIIIAEIITFTICNVGIIIL